MNQYEICTLLEAINPEIQKGMNGVILEVYGKNEAYELEFVKDDGTNYEYDGNFTFTVASNLVKKCDEK